MQRGNELKAERVAVLLEVGVRLLVVVVLQERRVEIEESSKRRSA